MVRANPRPACLEDAYEWLDEGRAVVTICPRADDVIVVSTKPHRLAPQDRFYLTHPEPMVRASYLIAATEVLRQGMAC